MNGRNIISALSDNYFYKFRHAAIDNDGLRISSVVRNSRSAFANAEQTYFGLTKAKL
jgi:hypothetical protein